jgi:hypothetical protein
VWERERDGVRERGSERERERERESITIESVLGSTTPNQRKL